jgi:hypothetical protein
MANIPQSAPPSRPSSPHHDPSSPTSQSTIKAASPTSTVVSSSVIEAAARTTKQTTSSVAPKSPFSKPSSTVGTEQIVTLPHVKAWALADIRKDLKAWEDALPASCRATKARCETIDRLKWIFDEAFKEIERDDWGGYLNCKALSPEGSFATDLLPWKSIMAMPGLKHLHLINHCHDRLPIELAALQSLETIDCDSMRKRDTFGFDLVDSVIALCEKSNSIRKVELGGGFLRREDIAKIEQFNAAHDGPPRPWGDKSWLQTAQQREVYDAANIGAARRIQIVADAKWGRTESHHDYNDSATLTNDAFHHVCERMLDDQVHNGGAVRMVALALDAPPGQFAPWPQIIAFRAQVQQSCEDAGLPEAAGPNHDHGWGSHCMIVLRGADKAETIDKADKIMEKLQARMQQHLPEATFTAAFGNPKIKVDLTRDALDFRHEVKGSRTWLLQTMEDRLAKAQADKGLLNASNPTT